MATDVGAESRSSLVRGRSGRVSLFLALGWGSMLLGRNALSPLLPTIIDQLSITPTQAGLALSLSWALYALLQFPAGRFADRGTPAFVIVTALLASVLGFSILGLIPTYPGLLIGGALIGAGTGLYFTPTRVFLAELFTERRGQAFGIQEASGSLGSALSAGLAIAALTYATWQSAFLPVIIGLVIVIVFLLTTRREPYDVTLAMPPIRETSARLLGGSPIRRVIIAYSLYTFVWQSVVTFLPTLLDIGKGYSTLVAGIGFAVLFVVAIVVGPLMGRLGDHVGHIAAAQLALALSATGLLGVIVSPTVFFAIGSIVVLAMGLKGFSPVMQAHVINYFPDESKGNDFGAVKTIYTGVGSLGSAYVGFVAQRMDYLTAFGGLLIILLLSLALIRLANREH